MSTTPVWPPRMAAISSVRTALCRSSSRMRTNVECIQMLARSKISS